MNKREFKDEEHCDALASCQRRQGICITGAEKLETASSASDDGSGHGSLAAIVLATKP